MCSCGSSILSRWVSFRFVLTHAIGMPTGWYGYCLHSLTDIWMDCLLCIVSPLSDISGCRARDRRARALLSLRREVLVSILVNLRKSRVPGVWRLFCPHCKALMVHEWQRSSGGGLSEVWTCLDCDHIIRRVWIREGGGQERSGPPADPAGTPGHKETT